MSAPSYNHPHTSGTSETPPTPANAYHYHPHIYQSYAPSPHAHYASYPGYPYPNQLTSTTPTYTSPAPLPPVQFQQSSHAYRPPLADTTASVLNSQPSRKRKAASKSSNAANKRQRQTGVTEPTIPASSVIESRESTPEINSTQPSVDLFATRQFATLESILYSPRAD